jgi:hypothetical protein
MGAGVQLRHKGGGIFIGGSPGARVGTGIRVEVGKIGETGETRARTGYPACWPSKNRIAKVSRTKLKIDSCAFTF